MSKFKLITDLQRVVTSKKIGILFVLLFGAFFFVWILRFFNLYEGMDENSENSEAYSLDTQRSEESKTIENEKKKQ